MKTLSFIASNFRRFSAKFSFLPAIPLLLGLVSVPILSNVAAPLTSHNPAAGLLLTGVVSTKTHGASGPFDINLPLSGPPGIECRSGGANLNHTLVFTFNHNMDPNANTGVTLTPGTGNVVPPLIFSGSTMRVNLTSVVNARTITITVIGAKDQLGETLPDTDVRMGVLLGDVTGGGLVNSRDIEITSGRVGQVVDATNFRSDINGSGAINAADVAFVRTKSGTGLPGAISVPGSGTQSLSFSGPTTINLGTATTFTVAVSLTFSGYSSSGLSYWMEADNALAPFIKTSNVTYFTFTTANQTTPNSAPFDSTTGTTADFMTEARDLGGTTSSAIAAGTYHITDLTFCLDPSTPAGTYKLRSTTVGPRFSEVIAESDDNYITPAAEFIFTVSGTGPTPTPTPCGVISGKITDNAQAPLQGAVVQACPSAPLPAQACEANTGCLLNASTDANGNYQITGVPLNTAFNLTVFPPQGSLDVPGALLNRTVSNCTPLPNQNLMLQLPVPPPPGTSIEPHSNGGGDVPFVYWNSSLLLTTTGCANGTASYTISPGSSTVAMPQTSPGTYQASVPPLFPTHGAATVTITIQCPGGGTTTIIFNIYIDPSGIVQNSHGALISGATVTLLRSDTAFGPFNIVVDGGAVMSPGNRHNPDVTDAQGHFGWDVLAGFYKVRAAKSGCNGIVETGALPIPPPVTDLVLTLECPTTELVTAVSRKAHGAAGIFSIPLPLSGQPGVECRTGEVSGSHTLVFTFSDNIVSGSASLTSGMGSVAGTPSFAGRNVTVNLTGVTDVQKITVTLSGVTDSFAQVLPDLAVSVNMLLGDTSGNKAVNSSDVSQTKLQSGQAVTATNFREDVNANGSINATDVGTVKLKAGTALP
jgi:dockerin type I repeat protein